MCKPQPNKGLLSRIYKNSLTQQYKKQSSEEMVKSQEGTFPQEDIQTAIST